MRLPLAFEFSAISGPPGYMGREITSPWEGKEYSPCQGAVSLPYRFLAAPSADSGPHTMPAPGCRVHRDTCSLAHGRTTAKRPCTGHGIEGMGIVLQWRLAVMEVRFPCQFACN